MREIDSEPDEEFLEPGLRRAIGLLRQDVPVRREWRTALLDEIALAERRPHASSFFRTRSIRLAPASAIAACAVALAAGASAGIAFTRVQSSRGQFASPTGLAKIVRSDHGTSGRSVIRFALVAPGAARVSLVGDFNGWDANATPMQAAHDGATWLVEMPLVAGRHLYAFVVDGDLVADPSAPRVNDDDFGVQNSVVLVGDPLP